MDKIKSNYEIVINNNCKNTIIEEKYIVKAKDEDEAKKLVLDGEAILKERKILDLGSFQDYKIMQVVPVKRLFEVSTNKTLQELDNGLAFYNNNDTNYKLFANFEDGLEWLKMEFAYDNSIIATFSTKNELEHYIKELEKNFKNEILIFNKVKDYLTSNKNINLIEATYKNSNIQFTRIVLLLAKNVFSFINDTKSLRVKLADVVFDKKYIRD
jgi:hypothetical protein